MTYRAGQCLKNGRRVGYVSWIEDGRRHRRFFKTSQLAEAWVAARQVEESDLGPLWASVPAGDRIELLNVWRECQRLGIPVGDLLRQASPPGPTVTVQQAIDALVAAKSGAARSPRYTASVALLLRKFASGRESQGLAAVTLGDLEAFLDGIPLASRSTYRARLATLFRFGVRRGWLTANPVDRLESVRVVAKPPSILTPEQAALALRWLQARPTALGWFVLSCLAGLRPEEAERTAWASVDLGAGLVRVEAQTSKVRQRRVVYPLPSALAWLAEAQRLGSPLPIPHTTRRRAVRALREALGWSTWPKDITRHTAASYWLAQVEDAAAVAEQLGHDVNTLKRHYRATVTREAAAAFWAILPMESPAV